MESTIQMNQRGGRGGFRGGRGRGRGGSRSGYVANYNSNPNTMNGYVAIPQMQVQVNPNGYRFVKSRMQPVNQFIQSGSVPVPVQSEPRKVYLREDKEPEFAVTKNGAIAIYNIQRQPVVLYAQLWEKLATLLNEDKYKNFVKENEGRLRMFERREDAQNEEDESKEKSD